MRHVEQARREYGAANVIVPLNVMPRNLVSAGNSEVERNFGRESGECGVVRATFYVTGKLKILCL
jgi:hypothetical protein